MLAVVYWCVAVGSVVVVAAEPSAQFHVYWAKVRPAGSLADTARVTASPAYVVGSDGLNPNPLIFGEPVPAELIVTVVRCTVKKSPPAWLTRRVTV